MRIIVKGFLLVLIGFMALLVPVVPTFADDDDDEMELRFLIGTGLLCDLADDACPAITGAENGDTIEVTGEGRIEVDDDNGGDAKGRGRLVHRDEDGNIVAQGSWRARRLLSFTSYGSGSVQGLPAEFQGGLAILSVTLRSDDAPRRAIRGILAVDCTLGDNIPAGAHEGFTLNIPGIINFDEKISGLTLFIAELEDDDDDDD